jgi:glutamate-1-semialdehyde 2,1-aminomutase
MRALRSGATDANNFQRSQDLRPKAHRLIPGGSHTYAKGDDQYPQLAPGFIEAGKGCIVRDIDGNEFIEYGMGLRAVTLGHAFEPVIAAVRAQLEFGSNFTRPAPIEVDCAEQFLSIVQSADMVKFAKDGSTVNTAAVRLARAYTGRTLVGICADDPFLSYNDWFIGTKPMSAGIPLESRRMVVSFPYNDIDAVRRMFAEHPRDIACVMLELERTVEPKSNFLSDLRDLCAKHGTLLIADEMITGFRWDLGGAQKCYDITPDLSTFGKAMANGFSVSALAGRREIMELGGISHNRERVFLLSTTHGAETHALAAAIKTMQIYKDEDVIGHLARQGRRLMDGVSRVATAHRVGGHFEVAGKPCNLIYVTRDDKMEPSQAYRALFLQELIRRGVLAPSFVVSFSHMDEHIDRTIDAVDGALWVYRRALDEGIDKYLIGPPVKPVFRPYC